MFWLGVPSITAKIAVIKLSWSQFVLRKINNIEWKADRF